MITELPIEALALPLSMTSEFVEALVEEHAGHALSLFLDIHGEQLQHRSSGLLKYLLRAGEDGLEFNTVWSLALGRIHNAVSPVADEIVGRAADIALRLQAYGRRGDWAVELEGPTGFVFDRWYQSDTLQILATPSEVTFRSRSSGCWTDTRFAFAGDHWSPLSGRTTALPEATSAKGRWIVLGRDHLMSPEVHDIASNIDSESPWKMVSRCNGAREILARYAPTHSDWVENIVRFVAPWRALPDERPSGSSSSNLAPGLVGIGHHDHTLALADSLVHEASHNYFYLALRIGTVHDGSDQSLYLNPFLDLERPIDRILLAYHAFANVLLFCRALKHHGMQDDYIGEREAVLMRRLGVLERHLSSTTALTPLGRRLFEPLSRQLCL